VAGGGAAVAVDVDTAGTAADFLVIPCVVAWPPFDDPQCYHLDNLVAPANLLQSTTCGLLGLKAGLKAGKSLMEVTFSSLKFGAKFSSFAKEPSEKVQVQG